MIALAEFVQQKDVMIAAHRGSSGTAPENTMAALRQAIEAGADLVEIDVQISADEHMLVFHDETLDRTTDRSGSVKERTYDELQGADAGGWFAAEFAGERIPLLGEALDLLQDKVYINVEIKPPQRGEDFTRRVESIAAQISARGLAAYTLFSSFHHPSLALLKQLDARFHTATIQLPRDPRLPAEVMAAVGADAFVCALNELSDERVAEIESKQIFTGVYTVNTAQDLANAMERRVKAIVTNYPARIAAALQKLRNEQ